MGKLKDRLIYALGGYTEEDRLNALALIHRVAEENYRLQKDLSEAKKELEKTRQILQRRSKDGLSKMCPKFVVDNFEFVSLMLETRLSEEFDEGGKAYATERVVRSILKEAKKYVQIDQGQDDRAPYIRAKLWVGAPIYDNDQEDGGNT